MATAKKGTAPAAPAEREPIPEPSYPVIEGFVEKATADDISNMFKDLKEQVGALKGPKAEQGKKVSKAIERTEELLSYLLQVREKLEADRKGKGGKRK
jgi:hypothetical protein